MGGGGGGRPNGRRGRGNGFAPAAGGGGNVQLARQLLLSLFGGGAGGGNAGTGHRRVGGAARPREGEWLCQCGFANRAHREACYDCGRPRPQDGPHRAQGAKGQSAKSTANARWTSSDAAAAKGGWTEGKGGRGAKGPVGADGRRPMLGTHGDARFSAHNPIAKGGKGKANWHKGNAALGSGLPQGKGPGAAAGPSDGIQQSARAGSGKPAHLDGGGKGTWHRPPRSVDADGYTLVQPRRVWQDSAGATEMRDDDSPTANGAARMPPPTKPRWADEEGSDDDDYVLDDLDAQDAEDAAEEGQEQGDDGAGQRLRGKYEAFAKAVRDMEKTTRGDAENPALATLREARDQAEKAWREAKTPAPLAIRMGRAQTKLDRAGAALTRARYAVEEFDEWAVTQRGILVQRMEDADQWYRWRQRQMETLHEEAGGRAQRGNGIDGADASRNAAVSERIMGDWLPAVQALLEQVQGNPEIEDKLASIAADMHNAGQELAAPSACTAERYDIGDDGNRQWDCQPTEQQGETTQAERGTPAAATATAGWRPEGPGRWAKGRGDGERGGSDGTGHSNQRDGGNGAAATTADARTAGLANQAASAAATGSKRGAADLPTEDKEPVRQKTDAEAREEADRRRAAELLLVQQQAIAAQQASHDAGAGGFGSETAQTVAAQHFLAQVCKAVEQARTMGIEPKSGTKQLVELTPMELKQWVADHIGDENSWA